LFVSGLDQELSVSSTDAQIVLQTAFMIVFSEGRANTTKNSNVKIQTFKKKIPNSNLRRITPLSHFCVGLRADPTRTYLTNEF